MSFGKNFLWGAATSSYQIEGGWDADGRTPSVWDSLCQRPGAVKGGANGNVACDHYNRVREDVGLMKDLGLQAYRFSFSWSRLLPEGTGRINEGGVQFYDRLIDSLLEARIEPFGTMFHWDFPTCLYHRGGWLNPESVDWFAEYARVLADRFSDRVQNWFTLNEPPCYLGLGHVDGVHAPGLKLDWPDFFLAAKHTLMAHGRAVQVLREYEKSPVKVSVAPISHVGIPINEQPQNIEAARDFTFGVQDESRSFWFARIYLDPILKGEWPEECVRVLTKNAGKVTNADLAVMNQPLDYLGLNFYNGVYVRANEEGKTEVVPFPAGHERTAFDWPLTPDGLYWSVRFHHERYGLPIAITENGLANLDWVSDDGKVHDPQRIEFTLRYLRQLKRAAKDGYPLVGYFHWSLMDNFEWAEGYEKRFGLIHVDFPTQRRTIKDSGHWYKKVIESNGTILSAPEHAAVHVPSSTANLAAGS